MYKKVIIAAMTLLISTISAWAQIRISGRVFDENQNSLPGAAVYLKSDTSTGTMTDNEGRYELEVKADGKLTLCISFIGYLSQEISISTSSLQVNRDIYMEPDLDLLKEVVVTGTRTPKFLKEAPIITRVISSDDIKRVDATNISDLLQQELPGIEFSYSMNQQVALNMQGFGGNSILFLVDGERVAGETLDNIDYNRLNLDNVEKIEIVKGAASSLYGSNAVGGVVNLISNNATEPWSVNINTRYGAHNDFRYGGSVGFKVKKVSNVTTFQGHTVDQIDLVPKDIPEAELNKNDVTKIYAHKSYNIKDRLVYTPSRKLKFIGNLGYFFRQREASAIKQENYRGINGNAKGIWNITDADILEGSWSYDEYDKSDYTPMDRKDIRDYCNVQQNVRLSYNHTFNGKHTLTAGTDYMYDYLMSYQFTDHGNHLQHTADAFAQFDWNPLKAFNMIAGLRYDWFSAANVHHVSPKLSMMYKLKDCSIRASYASGFRAPTLKEMYMSFNMANIFMIYGNPELKPEKSHNLSLSAEYMKKGWNVTVTGFYNFVDNRITTAWNQEKQGMVYTNMAPLQISGIDATAAMKLDCGIGTRISYVYTHEKIEKGQPILSSTRPHTMTAKIDYGHDWKNYGMNIALTGRFLSKVEVDEYTSNNDYESTERRTYPGYTIWKLNFTQRIWKGINLSAIVDNLFNYRPDYYYNNSPTTTGTTFSAGLSIDIEEFFKN